MFVAGNVPGIYTEAVRVDAVVPGEWGIVRAADFASVVIRKPRSPQRLEAVRVNPRSVMVPPGERAVLVAHAVDDLGDPADNVAISWNATSEGVGEIDDYGSFVATGLPGYYANALTAVAEQSLGGEVNRKTRSVDVTITGTLVRVEIRPTLFSIAPRRTVHFRATAWDENGVVLSGLVLLWGVSDERIGDIDAFGNFTAGKVPGVYENAIQAQVILTLPKPR